MTIIVLVTSETEAVTLKKQYDLSLNSYKLGIQGCIDMIKKMIKVKQEGVTI